jgi:hypothetical protein
MSITDELMEWARRNLYYKKRFDELTAIANRIEEAHKHAIGYVDDRDHETMAENGWVRLPVDADGVPIRIGDVMEGIDKYDTLKKVKGKVITVSFESDGTADVAIQAWNSDGKSWHRTYLDSGASVYRHYHEPTVEDVLREFSCVLMGKREFDGDVTEAVAEYAAKLRLAGETE